jgi:hypothetical protein
MLMYNYILLNNHHNQLHQHHHNNQDYSNGNELYKDVSKVIPNNRHKFIFRLQSNLSSPNIRGYY